MDLANNNNSTAPTSPVAAAGKPNNADPASKPPDDAPAPKASAEAKRMLKESGKKFIVLDVSVPCAEIPP